MKKRVLIIIICIVVMAVVFGLIVYDWGIDVDSSECEIENPDPDGYLLKICEYLIEHKDAVTPNKKPDDYKINSIENETSSGTEFSSEILVIRLDCCYTGDLAYIDKNTKEVIEFSPGDK